MIVESKAGYLFISFEEYDFKLKTKEGLEAWVEAKEAIKERFPYPESRYDGKLKQWQIVDSKANRAGLRSIIKLYFEDENQMELL